MPEEVCRVQSMNSAYITADCSGDSTAVSCGCCANCDNTAPSR